LAKKIIFGAFFHVHRQIDAKKNTKIKRPDSPHPLRQQKRAQFPHAREVAAVG
jgi:hypothetical protein